VKCGTKSYASKLEIGLNEIDNASWMCPFCEIDPREQLPLCMVCGEAGHELQACKVTDDVRSNGSKAQNQEALPVESGWAHYNCGLKVPGVRHDKLSQTFHFRQSALKQGGESPEVAVLDSVNSSSLGASPLGPQAKAKAKKSKQAKLSMPLPQVEHDLSALSGKSFSSGGSS